MDRHIGERIRAVREERGVSLGEMAEAIRVEMQEARAFEAGSRRVPASVLCSVVDLFAISLTDIFSGLDTVSGPHEPETRTHVPR